MRSYLLIPMDDRSERDAAYASSANALILDLEASLPQQRKEAARGVIATTLLAHKGTKPALYVRVNPLSSQDIMADLAAIMPAKPHAIILPQCDDHRDIQHLAALLAVHEAEVGSPDGSTRIIGTFFSTPKSIFMRNPLHEVSHRLIGITWDGQSIAQAIGANGSRDEANIHREPFQLARSLTLFAAHAAQVTAIDTPFPDRQDAAGLEAECLAAKRDGFHGKIALNAAQVAVINRVFSKQEANACVAGEL